MALEKGEPPCKRRLAFSFVHNSQLYLCLGSKPFVLPVERQYVQCRDGRYAVDRFLNLHQFDLPSARWSVVSTMCVNYEQDERFYWENLMTRKGMCCAVLGDCAYIFGEIFGYGSHELNLETTVWRRLEPKNREDGPMKKSYAGMVACGEETLCVFGGYGDEFSHRQPGAIYSADVDFGPACYYTNELHLFQVKTGKITIPFKKILLEMQMATFHWRIVVIIFDFTQPLILYL